MSAAPILRPYQCDAIAAVNAAHARGIQRPLLALPTGTGKTVIFADIIRQRPQPALVLAHRDELLEQAARKIRQAIPGVDIGLVKGSADDVQAPVVVASVQTISRPSRLARLTSMFSTVVVDEAHHASAPSYRRVLEHLGAFRAGGPLTLGVTATPERADGSALVGEVWQEIVYRTTITDMIQAGYLADLRAIRVHLDADFDRVHVRGGDLVPGELEDVMRGANAVEYAAAAYTRYAPHRRGLVFTPTVALAHEMAEAFSAAGISAEALDGGMATAERRWILQRLHTGATRVVTNCAVLTEGFDEPAIDCIVIARPTTSKPLYTQMIGRGTRIHPGKPDCLILDLVGSTTRHDLVSASSLFGLPPKALAGKTVSEALVEQCEIEAKGEAHGQLVAQTVDLFNRRAMHWVVTDATRYTLSLGESGILTITSPDMQAWTVMHVARTGSRTVLAEGLDLGFAQGTAEDFARRSGATALASRDAAWRRQPASPRQIDALRRWRIRVRSDLTRGEASDLIAAAVGRVA